MQFTKLFHQILDSTIWREPITTKITWITMLAMADKNGEVHASIPGLAVRAGITIEECELALASLLGPDKYSRTQDYDGRRVGTIDGGWVLLNHAKYRALLSVEERREYNRRKQAEYRERLSNSRVQTSNNVNHSQSQSAMCTHAESEAESDTDKNTPIIPLAGDTVKKGPLQLRAEKIFGRRESTALTAAEQRAFKKSKAAIEGTTEEEWKLLERFYKLPQSETYARKDLAQLVNNWNGEIDRAKSWFANNSPRSAGNYTIVA